MDIGIADLCVRHAGDAHALANVTLYIPKGQFCAVLGGSGAGKSTLLHALAGLVTPSEGNILYDGASLRPAQRPRIGLVPQDFALSGRASVARNIMAVADIGVLRSCAGLYPPADRARAARLLADLGLEESHLARRADTLSGGQKQRVAITRALLHRPAIILADEPVASLDPATGERALALLRDEARRLGATLLCSLHQPALALRFADRIIILDAGRVIFDGTPAMFGDNAAASRIRAVAQ